VDAIRLCDRQCIKITNQSHCIKNHSHLIASLIEHVFVQVLAVPKPRPVPRQEAKRIARAIAADKRRRERETREEEEAAKRQEQWIHFKHGGGTTRAGAASAAKSSAADDGSGKENKDGAKDANREDKKGNDVENNNNNNDDDEEEEEGVLDREVGAAMESAILSEPCYWQDEDFDDGFNDPKGGAASLLAMDYQLQVELSLSLARLSEQFVAAALSIQHSRSFDATCTVVPGCIAAIADAILRRRAADRPSEFCCILNGTTVDGRQLGVAGFGTTVGTFAEQTETMEIHAPELSVARTAVIDYFQSPLQQRLEKIFDWETSFELKPTRPLVKMLRHLCRAVALSYPRPHLLLLDGSPERSMLLKQYPEMRAYRDVAMWWKFFLNPDVEVFPNYSPDPKRPKELQSLSRLSAQLNWQWSDEEKGYKVVTLENQHTVRCRPDPKKTDPITGRRIPLDALPRNRYASTATPSFYCKAIGGGGGGGTGDSNNNNPSKAAAAIKTEDDVIYRPNLPTFEDDKSSRQLLNNNDDKKDDQSALSSSSSSEGTKSGGGSGGSVLSQRDSELLLSFLTVPYLRLPLVLTFFASDDRVHKLQSSKLKGILDSVLFEPGKYLKVSDTGVIPAMVPTQHPQLLSTAYGLLLNELHRSPETVLRGVSALLKGALALDTGAVCDIGALDFNTGVDIILYVTRLAARVDNHVSFLVQHTTGKHPCVRGMLREVVVDADCLARLQIGSASIRAR
jgi:hypothetical protein